MGARDFDVRAPARRPRRRARPLAGAERGGGHPRRRVPLDVPDRERSLGRRQRLFPVERGRGDPGGLGARPRHRRRRRSACRHADREQRLRVPERHRRDRVLQGHPGDRDPADRPGPVGRDAHDEVRTRRVRRVLAARHPGLLRRPLARPRRPRHHDRAADQGPAQVPHGDPAERRAVHRDRPARRRGGRADRRHHRRADRRRQRHRRAHPPRGERRP